MMDENSDHSSVLISDMIHWDREPGNYAFSFSSEAASDIHTICDTAGRMLTYNATIYTTLKHTAHTATHCNTLQNHCNHCSPSHQTRARCSQIPLTKREKKCSPELLNVLFERRSFLKTCETLANISNGCYLQLSRSFVDVGFRPSIHSFV